MKRNLLVFLAVILTLGLTACGKKQMVDGEFDGDSQAYFIADVLENKDKILLVEVVDKGNVGVSKEDQVYVSKDVENCPELVVGDRIKVVFNGEIMETYPLKLGEVFAIHKITVYTPEVEEKSEEQEEFVPMYSNSLAVVENGVIYSETEISDDHAILLANILNNVKWSEGTSDCLNDVMIKLDDSIVYYHFDCGTLNDTENNRSFKLSEKDQRTVAEIMFRYIGFK